MPFAKSRGAFRGHNGLTQEKEENMAGQGIDFINFIIDALDNDDNLLMKNALKKETPKQLYNYFQEKGYVDIPFKDCASILIARKAACGKGVNKGNHPVEVEGEEPGPPSY